MSAYEINGPTIIGTTGELNTILGDTQFADAIITQSLIGGGTTTAAINNSGQLVRSPVDTDDRYIYIWGDSDGQNSRLDDILLQTTSAGSGAEGTRVMSGGLVSSTNFVNLSNTDWKTVPTTDLNFLADSSGQLTRVGMTVTVGAGADGLYMAQYDCECNTNSLVASAFAFTFGKGTVKTGIYTKDTALDSVTIKTLTMQGLVRLVATETLAPLVISSGSATLQVYRQRFFLYRITKRTS